MSKQTLKVKKEMKIVIIKDVRRGFWKMFEGWNEEGVIVVSVMWTVPSSNNLWGNYCWTSFLAQPHWFIIQSNIIYVSPHHTPNLSYNHQGV